MQDRTLGRRGALLGGAAILAAPAVLKPRHTLAQGMDAARRWVESEFQPSTLTRDQQMQEMEWFARAA